MCRCLFCMVAKGKLETNLVYEDETVMAFLDIEPINEGHVLIIPKEHYMDVDELPQPLLFHLMEISQRIVTAIKMKYNADGYSIMQNGGKFNDIGHYHLHIFPRFEGDGFGWTSNTDIHNVNSEIAREIGNVLI